MDGRAFGVAFELLALFAACTFVLAIMFIVEMIFDFGWTFWRWVFGGMALLGIGATSTVGWKARDY